MYVLSIAAFHQNLISVVYYETIFHIELNISVVSVVNDKTIFQVILIVSAGNVVNDEIIFNVFTQILFLKISDWWNYFLRSL